MDYTERRDGLIRLHYSLGIIHRDILQALAVEHQIIVSSLYLSRILKKMGLLRRGYSDVADALLFIEQEHTASGQLHGYRWMHQKCKENRIYIRKEDIRLILTALDPQGCSARRSHRLTRRE